MGGQSERTKHTHTHARTAITDRRGKESPNNSVSVNETNNGCREEAKAAVPPPCKNTSCTDSREGCYIHFMDPLKLRICDPGAIKNFIPICTIRNTHLELLFPKILSNS